MAERRIRRGKSKGFFTLYRDSAQDARLSLEARGLFALMMSLPEDWEYSVSGLAVKAGCGKDRIRRILGELQDVGYLIREQGHDSGGKFSGNIYVLQDEAPPLSGKPDNGEQPETAPLSGKPDNGEQPETEPLSENTVNGENRQRETPLTVNPTQKNIDLTEEEIKRPPKAPQGGRRSSKYDLAEDAKPLLRAYCGNDGELAWALSDFIEIRKQLKAINSRRAITTLLSELDRLSGGDRLTKLLLIRQSIANSWKSVFPLKGGGPSQSYSRTVEEEGGTYAL